MPKRPIRRKNGRKKFPKKRSTEGSRLARQSKVGLLLIRTVIYLAILAGGICYILYAVGGFWASAGIGATLIGLWLAKHLLDHASMTLALLGQLFGAIAYHCNRLRQVTRLLSPDDTPKHPPPRRKTGKRAAIKQATSTILLVILASMAGMHPANEYRHEPSALLAWQERPSDDACVRASIHPIPLLPDQLPKQPNSLPNQKTGEQSVRPSAALPTTTKTTKLKAADPTVGSVGLPPFFVIPCAW